jgi:hypothetical protein
LLCQIISSCCCIILYEKVCPHIVGQAGFHCLFCSPAKNQEQGNKPTGLEYDVTPVPTKAVRLTLPQTEADYSEFCCRIGGSTEQQSNTKLTGSSLLRPTAPPNPTGLFWIPAMLIPCNYPQLPTDIILRNIRP